MKPETVAHLAIDIQNRFLFPLGESGCQPRDIGGHDLVPAMAGFAQALDKIGVATFWVASRASRCSAQRKRFKPTARQAENPAALLRRYDMPMALASGLQGRLLLKTRDSAFSNPALLKRLRRMQITTLLVSGLYAGQCVRATVQDAVAAGFHCRVIVDLIRDNRYDDSARQRRQRIVEFFAGNPHVEIIEAHEALHELHAKDLFESSGAPAIILPSMNRRILLHQFRQESRSGAKPMFFDTKRLAMTIKTDIVRDALLHSFQSIQDEMYKRGDQKL